MKKLIVNRKVAKTISKRRTDILENLIINQEGIYCSESRSVCETINVFIGMREKNMLSERE